MVSNEWFLDNYPEWVNSDDEDVRQAMQSAWNAIRPALFCQNGRLTRCLRTRMKEFLRKNGVDVGAYDRDYYRTKELHSDGFLMELGLVHLARHLIMRHKKEFHVPRRWEGYDYIRVYANDTDDAQKKAKAYPAPSHGLNSLGEVFVEINRAAKLT